MNGSPGQFCIWGLLQLIKEVTWWTESAGILITPHTWMNCILCSTVIITLFHLELLHHFFSLSIQHKRRCEFHISPTYTFFFFFLATFFRPVSQSDPVNALMHRFHARHLAGEITSGRHKRKKTMTGGHFRAKIISISGKEPSLWQSQPLQFSVRPWWIPAGGASVCSSFSLEILKIDPERTSLIMTSRQTAAAARSVDITMIFNHI